MANLSRLDQQIWLNTFLETQKEIINEVTFYTWPNYFDLPRFNCRVSLKISGNIFNGYAINEDRSLCLIIAISEALERYQWFTLKKDQSTNGYANHFCFETSIQSSLSEAYERDLVLSHFLTKTPYFELKYKNYQTPDWLHRVIQDSNDLFDVSFWHTHSINSQKAIVCKIAHKDKDFGATFGTKCHQSISKSITSSFLDALSRFHFFFIANNGHEYSNAIDTELNSTLDSINLSGEYLQNIQDLFIPNQESPKNDILNLKISCNRIPVSISGTAAKLFTTYIADKNELQDLYKGTPTTNDVNMERLRRFKKGFCSTQINTLPNPFY